MKLLYCLALFSLFPVNLFAQDANTEDRLKRLEQMLSTMQKEMKAKDSKIEKLEKKVNQLQGNKQSSQLSDDQLLDKMIQENHNDSVKFLNERDKNRIKLGDTVQSVFETLDFSVIASTVFGTSNLRNSDLEEFQGGAHDPKKRGFNFQQMELGISGTVDDLFDYQGFVLFLEDEVELEEAYITTRSLPNDLKVKAGLFLTEFGLNNQQHVHSWGFLDQPIINSRIFGGEGMRGPGASVSWLAPVPWYSEIIAGVQNSDGDYMQSFRGEAHEHGEDEEEEHAFEEGIGGAPFNETDTRNGDDFVWLARWVNTFEVAKDTTLQFGVSNLYGENHTGGSTWIYGADMKLVIDNDPTLKRPNWIWQTEIMRREYDVSAGLVEDPDDGDFNRASDDLEDWGLYTQVIKAINNKWSAGLRFEYVTGSGDSYEHDERVDREDDFDRSDRFRVSPLLIYQHSEFTKFRLQYNYDDSDTSNDGSTIWFGVEVLLGKHPAHKF